jgi:ligand-binding sensor domain-containing protein
MAQIGTWRNYMAYYEPQQIVKAGNTLFVRASNDLYQYNLTDHSITNFDKTTGLNDTYITHIAWSQQAQRLIIVYQNSNIDLMDQNGNVSNVSALYRKAMTQDKTIDSLTIDGIYAYLYARFGIVKVNMQRAEISDTYVQQHPQYPTNLPPSTVNADWDNYIDIVRTLKPDGPKYNYFTDIHFINNRLYTAPGYFVVGGADLLRPGSVQVWDGHEWQIYQERIDTITGYAYLDNNCIDVDPTDLSHIAVGGRCGLYEFKNGQLLKYHNKQNSLLKGAYVSKNTELDNDYIIINALKYDNNGNLWVLNSQAKGVNLLELKKDGNWISHYQDEIADNDGVSFYTLQSAIFDSRGYLWFINNHWSSPSFFCYNPSTDSFVNQFGTIVNQDGTTYNDCIPHCVAEDLDGNVWVGTNKGPFMVDKNNITTSGTYLTQIKIPRNDGTDYADYLLSGVVTTCMAIDGGGRKWFGTNGAGVYLISADNMTQLQHFTIENSQLLSNTIRSIAINNSTGEVFFGTENGLCSYISDATATTTEMTKDNIYAYPNPVTPDYTGLITIVGLTLNADVKIVSPSGKLIAQGRSNGGTFTWDGRDKNGDRVASGVYMVVTATSDGKKGTVCKIAVVK